ncbi:MAG: OsmC family peroxiredoxin [Chloroflexi bacterium]|nr:OsmC family peroxiredoxin [Chloroflexota bacterium]
MLQVSPKVKEVAQRQMVERTTGPAVESPTPVTTVKSTALFDLQFRATVEGHSFISDEAVPMGGHDAGPAPLRYFLAGIMMCHQVWTLKSAVLMGIQIDSMECEIAGYFGPGAPEDPRDAVGFARLTYIVRIDSVASSDQVREAVNQGTYRCPAFGAAKQATRIEVTVEHNGSLIETRTYGPGQKS